METSVVNLQTDTCKAKRKDRVNIKYIKGEREQDPLEEICVWCMEEMAKQKISDYINNLKHVLEGGAYFYGTLLYCFSISDFSAI
jgi:hypothetical protein